MRRPDHEFSPQGEGNVVSIEFNLLYRWHATISKQDAEWTTEKFKEIFEGKDLDKVFPFDSHRILLLLTFDLSDR
jgi:linoleate 10R-lipoxygenase